MNNLPKPLINLSEFKPNCEVRIEVCEIDPEKPVWVPAILIIELVVLLANGQTRVVSRNDIRPLPTPQQWTIYQIMAHRGGFRDRRKKYGKLFTVELCGKRAIFSSDQILFSLQYFIEAFVAVDANGNDHDMRGEGCNG